MSAKFVSPLALDHLERVMPEHWSPLFFASRNGSKLVVVFRSKDPFDLPRGPTIVVVGDDLQDAKGPGAFHVKSLQRAIAAASQVVIVSSGPELRAYVAAALPVFLGRTSVLIETRPEQEIPWLSFVREASPDADVIVWTVKGGTA